MVDDWPFQCAGSKNAKRYEDVQDLLAAVSMLLQP